MADTQILTKRMAIDKTNAQIVVVVAVAAFITVFCLFAAKAVWSQNSYQARVISAQNTASNQLKANIKAYGSDTTPNTLAYSYNKFVSQTTNVLGGSSTGTTNKDGTNAELILNALPSSYDYPALTAEIQSILTGEGLQVGDISGTDEELSEQGNNTSTTPEPVSMPFSFSVEQASYSQITQLVTALGQSIRPIQIDSIELTGSDSNMTATINAHTYYQPGKNVSITEQEVK
jgi:hypothetical protein